MSLLRRLLYRILDWPPVYLLVQTVLAPGNSLPAYLEKWLDGLPAARRHLDVGCGPRSWLWQAGVQPIGLDLSLPYARAFRERGRLSIQASAHALPVAAGSVDGGWSIFMLHHLPDAVARQLIEELLRARSPGGYVVLIDGIHPRSFWSNPLAWAIRRLDRGEHMRSAEEMAALLPDRGDWQVERFTYTWNGLGGLCCVYCPQRPAAARSGPVTTAPMASSGSQDPAGGFRFPRSR